MGKLDQKEIVSMAESLEFIKWMIKLQK
jgi:hypothetical protein